MAVLSISRQFGAGGKTLGEMVAGRLGFQFVDEAIVHKVAEEAKVSVAWVESVASEAGGRLMRFLATLVPSTFMQRHLGDAASDFDEMKYKDFLVRVIREVAAEGNAVILGRASQFILQDDPAVIKVLLVAERPDRVRFMMERYHLEKDKAQAMITRRKSAARKASIPLPRERRAEEHRKNRAGADLASQSLAKAFRIDAIREIRLRRASSRSATHFHEGGRQLFRIARQLTRVPGEPLPNFG